MLCPTRLIRQLLASSRCVHCGIFVLFVDVASALVSMRISSGSKLHVQVLSGTCASLVVDMCKPYSGHVQAV